MSADNLDNLDNQTQTFFGRTPYCELVILYSHTTGKSTIILRGFNHTCIVQSKCLACSTILLRSVFNENTGFDPLIEMSRILADTPDDGPLNITRHSCTVTGELSCKHPECDCETCPYTQECDDEDVPDESENDLEETKFPNRIRAPNNDA